MNTLFTALNRTFQQPKRLAAMTLITLPLMATDLLTTGLPISSVEAAVPTLNTPTAIEQPMTDLYAMAGPLVGSWRATDAAVLEMLDTLYGESGMVPESITGSVYLNIEETGVLMVTYNNLQMIFPDESGLPPVTLRGQLGLSWTESEVGVISVTGESVDLEAEVLGMAMPAPEVPFNTSSSRFEIDGERLSFNGFTGFDSSPIFFPSTWLRVY
ncbi:MAG: hypothetical protein AAFR58_03160 [Cyanobacteria bacterium J06627_28]